jgi:hypothetical protein
VWRLPGLFRLSSARAASPVAGPGLPWQGRVFRGRAERIAVRGIWYDGGSRFPDPIPRSRSMSFYRLQQIVSGGQTGVDRAALDAAIYLQIPHGGWCPRGRLAEDGPIDRQYQLRETAESDYAVRTEKNVLDSNGTLILHYLDLSGGTKLTSQLAARYRRPRLIVDLAQPPHPELVIDWLVTEQVSILNIAGPRESSVRGIGRLAEEYLLQVFTHPLAADRLGWQAEPAGWELDSDGT